jgi:hypothetical protein
MALTNPHYDSEVGLLTIGGIDLTCSFENAQWTVDKTNTNVGGPCREGDLMQTTNRQGTLSGSFFGGTSNGFVTNYADLTAITVGALNIKPNLYSLSINGSYAKQRLPGWVSGTAEGITKKNYAGSLELQLDDTDLVQQLVIAAESSSVSGAQVALAFTLLGTTVTMPIQLDGTDGGIQTGEFQKVTLPFVAQAPARGTAFPTTPTSLPGSPGLLDWALLSPRTNRAFTFTSRATHGLVRTGFLTFDSFSFVLSDGEVTQFEYTFKTYGDFTTSNNGS